MEKLNVPLIISSRKKNLNGRTYSKKILNGVVKNLKKIVDNKLLLGEIGHQSSMIVNLFNASHLIKNLRVEKNILFGDVETLKNKKGKVLSKKIKDVVFRPRGVGNLDKNGKVLDDYRVISFDAIPKEKDAFKNIL